MDDTDRTGAANPALIDKLRKVLALTTSPEEHEAALASEMLQRLLTEHNLSIADLEARGAKPVAAVGETKHDLGKAAYRWKLDLALAIANHYYCEALIREAHISTRSKVAFIGRPDNVESLQMLYVWLIDQIARIAKEERRKHIAAGGDHIDPLRWQIGFGDGAVERLGDRLQEMKRRREAAAAAQATRTPDGEVVALVLHHLREANDYLEHHYGRRNDGQETKAHREARERWEARDRELERLKQTDIEAYYRERPWERPETEAQRKARKEREEAEARREARNARRRKGRPERGVDWAAIDREIQQAQARKEGRRAADQINLEPFLGEGSRIKGSLK